MACLPEFQTKNKDEMKLISLYGNEKQSKNCTETDIEYFLSDIKKQKYEDKVLAIRIAKKAYKENPTTENKEKLKSLKGSIPRVTISGLFSKNGRTNENLIQHSGFIDIDIDGLDPKELQSIKQRLSEDKYCYSVFTSCGGDGLAFIVKIDPNRHLDAWDGLAEYFYKNYKLSIDIVHKAVANTRNISSDSDLFYCENSMTFKEYTKKTKDKAVQVKFVYVKTDIDETVKEIVRRNINLCDTYQNYRAIGFAIGSRFGESGRGNFHDLCSMDSSYNHKSVERDYKAFCKEKSGGITIGSFYAKCKELGIEVYSQQTKIISSYASIARKSGKSKEDTIKNLDKFEGIPPSVSSEIIDQVFDNKIEFEESDSIIPAIQQWLRSNYSLRRNDVTNDIENNGIPLDDYSLNSIFVDAKIMFGSKAATNIVKEIISSNFIESYNPFNDYFQSVRDRAQVPLMPNDIPKIITDLWNTFKVKDMDFLVKFGTKWLVSIIAAAHYEKSELMLILQGDQNVGKSEFFKRLLPDGLKNYKCTIKWNKGKDDEITLTKMLLVIDDELESHDKKTSAQMKATLSDDSYYVRQPFGTVSKNMKRLSVLCGTSNPTSILTDVTGNRRFIPINVESRNHKAYDRIDRDELFATLYEMYKAGFNWKISSGDIKELNAGTSEFEHHSAEYELITKYFKKGNSIFTSTDIKVFLEAKTGQRLSLLKIGGELARLGFEKRCQRVNGVPKQVYMVEEINHNIIEHTPSNGWVED